MSRIYEALQKAESENIPARRSETASDHGELRGFHARAAALADQVLEEELYDPLRSGQGPSLHTRLDLNAIPTETWNPDLNRLPALEERGSAVEQFRSLRSRIHELRDLKPMKSILISSGVPQEGKSFIAANLAVSLARNKNSKVLLIDGDMRRHTLHQLLGTTAEPGLADYLAGRVEMTAVMQRPDPETTAGFKHLSGFANLTLIPGGDGGDRAADLSGSPRFGDLLEAAATLFDWIIVDSSPVLPVSDAVNLSRSTDAVLLVARSGVTDFTVAQRAQAELKAANLLGFVLNAVTNPPKLAGYYGYDNDDARVRES